MVFLFDFVEGRFELLVLGFEKFQSSGVNGLRNGNGGGGRRASAEGLILPLKLFEFKFPLGEESHRLVELLGWLQAVLPADGVDVLLEIVDLLLKRLVFKFQADQSLGLFLEVFQSGFAFWDCILQSGQGCPCGCGGIRIVLCLTKPWVGQLHE